MTLAPNSLASSLESDWLGKEDGNFPDSVSVSADRFATAFASWFAGATAGPASVTTAAARKAQLASLAIPALSAMAPQAAGTQLANAIAAYVAGQMFAAPTGVAAPPTASAAGGSQLGAAFADLDSPPSARAQKVASACHLIVSSAIVTFVPPPPVPPPPAPVT
jgi:hypothetical protein